MSIRSEPAPIGANGLAASRPRHARSSDRPTAGTDWQHLICPPPVIGGRAAVRHQAGWIMAMNYSSANPHGAARHAPAWIPLLIILLMLVPLALTPLLPAVDFHSHVLRYWILADNGETKMLADNYSPAWSLIPNLGLDILGTALLNVVDPIWAGRILSFLVLLAPCAGALLLAHAVQGRVTVFSCLMAAFLGFSHIFTWGFANYLLGTGLMLAGLAWWLGQRDNPGRQLAGTIVLGAILMMVHALAFAVFGLMLGMVELALALVAGWPGIRDLIVRAARLASVAIVPALLFLFSRTAEAPQGVTAAFSNLSSYPESHLTARLASEVISRIDLLLRITDSLNPWADRAIGAGMWAIVLVGLYLGALRLAPPLRFAVALALALVLLLPPNLFGSGYTNDRMPLLLWSLLAGGLILKSDHRLAQRLTMAAALLFVAHIGLVTISYHRAGNYFRDFIAQTAEADLGPLAAAQYFSGTERSEYLPYCSGFLPLLAFTKGTAVPTFSFPTQQPLELDGALKAASANLAKYASMEQTLAERQLTDTRARQDRIARQLSFGYSSVVVCDGAGPVPSNRQIVQIARGPFWAIYKATSGTVSGELTQ